MQAYLGGQSVTASIPLVDTDGDSITASAASYRVIDQSEVELVAPVAATGFTAGDTRVVVTVPGAANTLTAPRTREVRVIELTLTTDEGTVKLTHEYFIEASEMLVEGVNSFQNYSTALLGVYDIPNMAGWGAATKPDHIAAMIQARRNMGALRFRYVFDFFQNIVEPSFGVRDLTLLTVTEYLSLPEDFKAALRLAQLLEADNLIGGDPINAIRRSGVILTSTGESKQIFKDSKPLEQAICRRAMMSLAKYVSNRVRVGRAGGPTTEGSPYSGMF